MGFFSWKTADTKESIPNLHSSKGAKTVYLLQPDGEPPIKEEAYEGYGVFGGVSSLDWLAKANLPAEKVAGLDRAQIRSVGILLSVGDYYVDTQNGTKHSVFHKGADILIEDIIHHPDNYSTPLAHFDGATANELIASGRLKPTSFEVRNPLKFSFDPAANYEDLPASETCDVQGYFYDADEE